MTYCIAYPPRKPRRFYDEAACEYEKRLGRLCRLQRIDHINPNGERDLIIAFSPKGVLISSEDMASRFLSVETGGVITRIIFIVKQNMPTHSDEVWALTSIGIPEDLLLVLLLEQIYRAQKIMHNEPYHK